MENSSIDEKDVEETEQNPEVVRQLLEQERIGKIFQRARRTIESIRKTELLISPDVSQYIFYARIAQKGDMAYTYPNKYEIPRREYSLGYLIGYNRKLFEKTGKLEYAQNYLDWVDKAFDNGLIAPNNDNYAKLQELQDKYEQLESDNFALSRSRDDLKKLNQRLSEQNVQLEKELKELQAEFDKSREKKPI